MRVLALDISTSTGWALLEGESGSIPKILESGSIQLGGPVSGFNSLHYPWDYITACQKQADALVTLAQSKQCDTVVIEETNRAGRFTSRYSQKILEWLHCFLLLGLQTDYIQVRYINTSDWRKAIGATLTKADKALNVKVRKLKKAGDKEGLKKLGVRGKIGKKHVAVRFVNQTFGTSYKLKDNDECDAICQGVAYFLGVPHCDGIR